MLTIRLQRQDVPCMQGLAVWCCQVERSDLIAQEAPLLRYVHVLKPCKCYTMQVDNVILQGRDREKRYKGSVDANDSCQGTEKRFQHCSG